MEIDLSNQVNIPPPHQGEGRGEVIRCQAMRFGVMCNGTVFQQWQADAILELKKHGHLPVLLIIDARPAVKKSLFSRLLHKKWSTFLFISLENRFFQPEVKMPVDLHREMPGVAIRNCLVEKRGFSEHFNTADVNAIRDHELDFILRFGFNIIRGDILSAARFGVWSFHHGDEMKYRGGPAGFWEIYRGDPVSGAVLQRLTDRLDGGIILKKGYLKTVKHSYRGNLRQLFTVSSSWPAQVASELSFLQAHAGPGDFMGDKPVSKTTAPVFRVPGNGQMLRFLFLLMKNRISFHYQDLFAAEIWNVGMIRRPIQDIALGREKITDACVTWLEQVPKAGYMADPAGFWESGKLHILAEEYSYADQKAVISEVVTHPDGVTHPVRVLDHEKHLSYPYIIEYQGNVFCLPESHQSCNITLFRRDASTGKFTTVKVLLDHVAAVDPTLFFYNDLWWLFYTDREYSNTHLFLYYSNEMTGVYKPHRLNPVKTDIRSARPAGTTFVHEGILYRPAQDCSVTYGGRVAVNRILRLSPDDFEEETVSYVEPLLGSEYGRGLHTLSAAGSYTLIDGKKYRFSRHFFSHQLRKKLKRKEAGNV